MDRLGTPKRLRHAAFAPVEEHADASEGLNSGRIVIEDGDWAVPRRFVTHLGYFAG